MSQHLHETHGKLTLSRDQLVKLSAEALLALQAGHAHRAQYGLNEEYTLNHIWGLISIEICSLI